jgi:hypothetical protein
VDGLRFSDGPDRTGYQQAPSGFYAVLVISFDSNRCGKDCQTPTFREIDRLAEDVPIHLAHGGVCHRIDWIRSIDNLLAYQLWNR